MMSGMRSIIALLMVVIAATFASGYFSLSYRLHPKSSPDYSEIIRTRKGFVDAKTPVTTVDLNETIARESRPVLLNPASNLPTSTRYPYPEITRLYRFAQSCAGKLDSPKNEELRKAWEWHAFQCGQRPALSDGFFERKPWLHPSGSSYAFMAFKSGLAAFQTQDWLSAHTRWMHVLEWNQIPKDHLTESQKIISTLDRSALTALFEDAPIALSQDSILIEKTRSARAEGTTDSVYGVYPRQELQAYLRSTPVILENFRPNQSCLLKEGNGCWDYNIDKIFTKARTPTLFLTGLTLILAGIVTWLLVLSIRRQKIEAERTRFALRTLTHELRTPVTDLVLSSEVLRGEFDRLSADAQDAFLRILNDIQRLLRLTENSKHYLGAVDQKIITTNTVKIPSVREIISEIAAEMNSAIVLNPKSDDVSIELDPFWLTLCLRNLLHNALNHGKPPIEVRIESTANLLKISVIDQGSCDFETVKEITTPFRKGKSSQGLGLGLSIVEEVARAMMGKLEFQRNPTTFTLIFPFSSGSIKR